MLLLLLQYSWWLQNQGVNGGLVGEDINWTDSYSTIQGKNTTIVVMSDGARLTHSSYSNRTDQSEFYDIFEGLPYQENSDCTNNNIGTASLQLAAGNVVNDTNPITQGIAKKATVFSYLFQTNGSLEESFLNVGCKGSNKWDVAIVQYLMTNCVDRFCRYIQPDVFSRHVLDECLYNPPADNWAHPIVVPAGANHASDPLFSPPAGWPMIFTIAGVSHRGQPLWCGAEGAGVFMCCPAADDAAIPAAGSCSDTEYISNFSSTNASAAIFAGGLSVLLSEVPTLKLADLFFITAMTADKNRPKGLIWRKNGFGLNYNRRSGFGRLNLGRALDLAKRWESVGDFYLWKKTVHYNTLLDEGIYNITFDMDDLEGAATLSVCIEITALKLSFGSLNPHLVSPSGTRCEIKILTESDKKLNIEIMEFNTYNFVAENPKGTWTLYFMESDHAARGLIKDVTLNIFYTKKAPKASDIWQRKDCANPWNPQESKIRFLAQPPVPFEAGKKFSIDVQVPDEQKNIYYMIYLESEDRNKRVIFDTSRFNENYTKIEADFIPTVYANGLKIYLLVESLHFETGLFTDKIALNYSNPYSPGIITPKNGTWITTKDIRIELIYALNLTYMIDEGYSTSAALTIINARSHIILDRKWLRNLGRIVYWNDYAKDKSFIMQISPSSSLVHNITFKPMEIYMFIKETPGKYQVEGNIIPLITIVVICIGLVILVVGLIYRSIELSRHKTILY